MTTQSPAPQEPAGHGRVWPYLAGAAAAAALGVSLFAMGSDPEPSPTPAASAGSAQARVSEAPTAPVTSPATSAAPSSSPSPASSSRDTGREKSSQTPIDLSGKGQVSEESVSPEREAQMQVEQQAQARAVAGADASSRQRAEQVAEAFVLASNERTWQTGRQQWVQRLQQLATPGVVESVNVDQDWESDSWRRFVEAKAETTTQIQQVQAQTLTNDGQIEVEVEFVTETDSEDPWVSNPPVRKSLVLVVDPAQGMVVDQLDMTPRGGL